MERKASLDGDINISKTTRSATHSSVIVPETMLREADKKLDSKKSMAKGETTNSIPFYKLFSFADSLDLALMFVGTIGAVGNGMATPLMTVIFGNLIDAFGGTTNPKEVVHDVSKVLPSLLIYVTNISKAKLILTSKLFHVIIN